MNEKLRQVIENSRRIAFLGGAGLSTESGIPDFRSADGIYKAQTAYGHSPEVLLSHDFFWRHTEVFYDYYRKFLLYPDAKPNKAHKALAKLEQDGKLTAVITQNIDGLHQAAGSRNVLELHGSVHRNYCTKCRKFYPMEYILESEGVPTCSCGGVIKPDVVLYGEGLDTKTLVSAVTHIQRADTLIVGGTSLVVYPAAGLVQYYRGHRLVLINKSPTALDASADLLISAPIGQVLSRCVNETSEEA
jgi:NAD-dependent deacetylase